MEASFWTSMLEPIAQYGALGIICIIFLYSMTKQSAQMFDMNKKLFEYFMRNNEETNNSIKSSINSIVNIISKNNDNINQTKHSILDEMIDLKKELAKREIAMEELNKALITERAINKYKNPDLEKYLSDITKLDD